MDARAQNSVSRERSDETLFHTDSKTKQSKHIELGAVCGERWICTIVCECIARSQHKNPAKQYKHMHSAKLLLCGKSMLEMNTVETCKMN